MGTFAWARKLLHDQKRIAREMDLKRILIDIQYHQCPTTVEVDQ